MYKYFKRREKQQKISLAQNISPILSRLHKYVKKVVTKLIPSKNYCTCLGLGGWQHFDQNCTFSLLKYLQAEPTHMSCRQFSSRCTFLWCSRRKRPSRNEPVISIMHWQQTKAPSNAYFLFFLTVFEAIYSLELGENLVNFKQWSLLLFVHFSRFALENWFSCIK